MAERLPPGVDNTCRAVTHRSVTRILLTRIGFSGNPDTKFRSVWIGIQFRILIRIPGIDDKKLLNFKPEKYPFLSEFDILYPYEATGETSSPKRVNPARENMQFFHFFLHIFVAIFCPFWFGSSRSKSMRIHENPDLEHWCNYSRNHFCLLWNLSRVVVPHWLSLPTLNFFPEYLPTAYGQTKANIFYIVSICV